MKTFHGIAELQQSVGAHLGYSAWFSVSQAQIDLFAEATGDHQWIHVDPERAASGPFRSTIAHGYLTLSLISRFTWDVYKVTGITMGVNYGLNKVRFPAPVPVDSRIRAGIEVLSLEPGGGGYQLTCRVTIERDGGEKPVAIAETLSIIIP